jgi:hypothetical protein
MARTAIILNNPTVTFADTLIGLDTSPTFECQLISAVITPQPVYNTIPATGCAGATQSPGRTGFSLDLTWLTDWGAVESLSQFAWDNDGTATFFRFTDDGTAAAGAATTAEGQAYVAAGGFGGTFGDGSAAQTTATWPCVDKPTIGPSVVAAAADTSAA